MSERVSLARDPDPQFAAELETRLLSRLVDGITPLRPEEDLMTIELDTPTQHVAPRRNWWLAAAAVIAVVGLGALLLRQNDDDSATSGAGRDVSFEVQWPELRERPDCVTGFTERHGLTVNGCLRSFKGVTQFTGDMVGEGLWSMAAGTGYAVDNRVTTPAPFNATYLFSGEVPGCGTGEFMMAAQMQFVGWDAGEFIGTWSIVPNSGRFELQSIAGSGDVLPSDGSGPRMHSGSISC